MVAVGPRLLALFGKRIAGWSAAIILLASTNIHPQLNLDQQRQLQQYQQMERARQTPPQDESPWTTSYWDLGQNIKIDQINEHFKSTDGHIDDMEKQIGERGRELSDVEARSSVWFSIIGAAVLGALGISANNFLKIKDKQ